MSFSKSEEVGGSHNISKRSLVKNGFFNYLRDFCQRNSALTWPEIAREGARSWKHLSEEERSRYQIMSSTDTDIVALQMNNEMCNHPMGRMGGGLKGKSCAKPRKACARQKKSCAMQRRKMACAKPKIRAVCVKPGKAAWAKPRRSVFARPRKPKCESNCTKPGPVTNNGYLNFVGEFRKRNCDLSPQKLIAKAARAGQCLPEEEKDRFRRMACRVATSPRHKRRRVCNMH